MGGTTKFSYIQYRRTEYKENHIDSYNFQFYYPSSKKGQQSKYILLTRRKLAITLIFTHPWSSIFDLKNSSFTRLSSLEQTVI